MRDQMGKGLGQLLGVSGKEALVESDRLMETRSLKEKYWKLKRSIKEAEIELSELAKKNSLELLLGHDLSSDVKDLKYIIKEQKARLRSVTERLEELDIFMERTTPDELENVHDESQKKTKMGLLDMEFDTRNLFDVGDTDLPGFEQVEEIPYAEEIYPYEQSYEESIENEIKHYEPGEAQWNENEAEQKAVRPKTVRRTKKKRVARVRKRKVISSWLNDIITQANRAEKEGAFDVAIEILERELKGSGEHEEMLYQLGNLHFRSGDPDKARMYYLKAIEKNPHSFRSLNNLGILYQSVGRTEDAIRSFNSAIEVNGNYERAWYNLGSIFMEIEPPMFEEASIFMKRALECYPEYSKAKEKLALCRSMLG